MGGCKKGAYSEFIQWGGTNTRNGKTYITLLYYIIGRCALRPFPPAPAPGMKNVYLNDGIEMYAEPPRR